ncbi:uncharacterized protein LOC126724752 isoform X2 [Quercus robur]|uniref:uncharacterized protein LOC126724752 isoform X2 n=1 Tax=Quercus robur TaxID=38942 RepID=UPI002161BC85|nr:uncharacterized protein LOC126724752 isoform X2 [Quercus robur]
MDIGTADSEPRQSGSFNCTSSASSSLRRRSISLSAAAPVHIDDDIESEIVSEAGDIGDRALYSNRHSESSSHCFSVDHALENGVSAPTSGDTLLHLNRYWSRDPPTMTTISVVTPLPEGIISPLSTDATECSKDKKQDNKERLPKLLEYALCLIHLAVFGILGVLPRYVLQKLFGPGVTVLTNDENILYLDLPSNMVGSFLMGWWGIVFKADISSVSDYLAIGLTTGYLGSLTTFNGWNQKMLDLIVDGHWVVAVLGFLVGSGTPSSSSKWRVDSFKRHLAVMVVLILMLGLLWGVCGALLREEFSSGSSGAQLWLACFVGPPGVWIRWFLARLNGRGLGRAGLFKWVPFGTLAANVTASCIMAALSTVKKALSVGKFDLGNFPNHVNSQTCDTVASGIQLGFLGCLSTASTFIAEFNAMRESKRPWRAYAYALITICISFGLGILIYSVPVWTKGYG